MKRLLIALGLIGTLGASTAPAQRVSVSIEIGAPFVTYHPRYHRTPYVVYHPRSVYRSRPALIVVTPRVHRPTRVVVVQPRHHPRRHHRSRR